MMQAIFKSWKTTVLGLLLIGAAGYVLYTEGEVTVDSLVMVNMGIALIFTKDANVSGK